MFIVHAYSFTRNGLTINDCICLSSKTQFNQKKSIKTMAKITDTQTKWTQTYLTKANERTNNPKKNCIFYCNDTSIHAISVTNLRTYNSLFIIIYAEKRIIIRKWRNKQTISFNHFYNQYVDKHSVQYFWEVKVCTMIMNCLNVCFITNSHSRVECL